MLIIRPCPKISSARRFLIAPTSREKMIPTPVEPRSPKKVTIAVTGVIALIPATPFSPMKNPAMMLSLSNIRYMTALVNVPDISIDMNFFSQNPFMINHPIDRLYCGVLFSSIKVLLQLPLACVYCTIYLHKNQHRLCNNSTFACKNEKIRPPFQTV